MASVKATLLIVMSLFVVPACLDHQESTGETTVGELEQGLSDPAARRTRSEHIRDAAATKGMTNGVLLAGIAQVETGLSHCWSEATWACQGPHSSSCGGPVIAGAADGPCSAQQGGLGMFQFDGGTYQQTLDRDGVEILELDGNIAYAVDFVAERVRQEVSGVNSIADAIAWLNAVPVQAGDPVFEEWIAIVSCRYNGCCGCSSQEAKYRNATLDALGEFEPGFWGQIVEPPMCEPISDQGAVLDEDDACAVAGGNSQYWRVVSDAGYSNRLLWTHTTDSANTENYGQWNLDFTTAGTYRLEVHTDGGTYGESRQARYQIRHAGQLTEVLVDQSAVDGFQLLAELEFDAGPDQWVRFDDNTGEPLSTQTRLVFDALRVTPSSDDPNDPIDPVDPNNPVDPNEPRDGDDDGGGGIIGGCNTGSGGGGLSLVVIALGLVAMRGRRRRSRSETSETSQ